MIIDYKPQDADYEGEIKFDAPKYTERLKYLRDCNFGVSFDADGQAKVEGGMENLDAVLKALEFAKKHVKEVRVRRKSDQKVFKSYEELLDDADEVCNEIVTLVLQRPSLGKN